MFLKSLGLLFLASLLMQGSAIMFKLVSNEPTCLKIKGPNTYVLEYVVSGESGKNVKVEIYDGENFVTRRENQNDERTTLKFENSEGRVCFSRTDGKEKSISFDFYAESDPTREIIDKKDIAIAMRSLKDSINSLKEVGRNQKFHIERNEINRNILEKSESKIKWAGIIKIAFLITSALIQLWIMKSFFQKNSVPYQPVDQA